MLNNCIAPIKGKYRKNELNIKPKPIELPQVGTIVKVIARDRNGNEKVEILIGQIVKTTDTLIFLRSSSKGNYLTTYLKTDIQNGIYKYEYI